MEAKRRKELQEAWKNRHPDMGVLCMRCDATGETFLVVSKDTATGFNRHKFQLGAGMHPNKHLQKLWNEYGENGFTFEVAGLIKYDDPREDQSEKLEALLEKTMAERPGAVKL